MNYSEATIEELAQHVINSTCQAVTQQLTYHKKRNHTEIVEKIAAARLLARKVKLTRLLESLNG